MKPVIAAALLLSAGPAVRLSAQDSFPAKPPAPGPLAPVRFPPFREARLPNGVNLVVIENHEQPTVSVTLSFRAGGSLDPAGKDGLAELAAELLTKGMPTRTAEQLAATIEGVGGSLSASAGQDFLTISASALTDHFPLAFELLGDVVRNATFPAEELELARTRYLSQHQLNLSQPEFLADQFFDREIYGAHPYGRRASEASYKAITRDDLTKYNADRLRPTGALLVFAGDITLAQARAFATRHLAGWTGTPAPPVAAPAAPNKVGTDILLIHRPGSVQANIVLGNTTMMPRDTNYYAARLATQVLGGGADARLFLILREHKSWTYGAYAGLNRARDLGNWQATAEVRTEVTDSALAEMLRQVERIRTEAVPDSELAGAKGFLVGVFPLTIETPGQIANQVATVKLLDLPVDYLQNYRERLAAVGPARARAAARQVYRRDALTIVVVGDATKLYEKLKAIAPVRMVDVDGQVLTAEDLAPKPVALPIDRAALVARTDSFRILVQGNPMGTQVTSLRRTADSLVYRESSALGSLIQQQTTVVFDPATFSVRRVDQSGQAQGQTIAAHLEFSGNRVKGRVTQPQESGTPKTSDIDTETPPWTYDDNSWVALFPTLPLEAGKSFAMNIFSTGSGATRLLTIKVSGPEAVTVPAGTFQAFRLDVTGGDGPFIVYISSTAPRRVVKIAPVGPPILIELVK